MPSPENVSELVLYSLITVFVLVILFFAFRVSPIGRKMKREESKWDFSQPILPRREPRQKYVDPVSGTAVKYIAGVLGSGLLLAFIYYVITRGGFGPGN